ncbi:hypothetical protein LJC31_02270 [Synergistaceae bacterium OttesenSCG-928-I11]|nr:hypothetical protein [Synergistaceae bacterium OttesenSCG-928-I11]
MMNMQNALYKIVTVFFVILTLCRASHAGESEQGTIFNDAIDKLRLGAQASVRRFVGSETVPPYDVTVRSEAVGLKLKNVYTLEGINDLLEATRAARKIDVVVRPWGTFVQAASFESADMGEATNYDAIWVRDSVWAYFALAAEEETRADAKAVLLTLLDYMATSAQLQRMRLVVSNPALVDGDAGDMNAVHIRFDSKSREFLDVQENGQPQPWKHKQNDALGLLLDAALSAYRDGLVTLAELKENDRLVAMAGLFAYLDAVDFHLMEDSGAWEEIARRNTSSIGLVTSAVTNLFAALKSDEDGTFAKSFENAAKTFGKAEIAHPFTLAKMLLNGYGVIHSQLALGGESPDYEPDDEHFRTADAALLNLIYPARLERLRAEDKLSALALVATLTGDFGIARYAGDNYQSANFWFKGIRTDTDVASHEERRRNFIPGTEAEWFFDSWLANCALHLYDETGDRELLSLATKHLNRALGQITGEATLQADGRLARKFALPESYNFLERDGELFAAASPICPLNWAKASLTLGLRHFQRILSEQPDK